MRIVILKTSPPSSILHRCSSLKYFIATVHLTRDLFQLTRLCRVFFVLCVSRFAISVFLLVIIGARVEFFSALRTHSTEGYLRETQTLPVPSSSNRTMMCKIEIARIEQRLCVLHHNNAPCSSFTCTVYERNASVIIFPIRCSVVVIGYTLHVTGSKLKPSEA